MSEFCWKHDADAQGWSTQVGAHGDIFQLCLLKSFILSCISCNQTTGMPLESLFPRLLHKVDNTPLETLADVSAWREIVGKLSGQIDLSRCLVVDLGCGEGFMLRFLRGLGATCVGLDYSEPLLKIAEEKLASIPGALVYERTDLRQELNLEETILAYLNSGLQNPKDAKSLTDFDELIVISTNVLDHIQDPAPLLGEVLSLCRQAKKAKVLLSTLNPAFFTQPGAPRRVMTDEFAAQSPSEFQFPWSSSCTRFFPRGWADYDGLFSEAGFSINYFFRTDLGDLKTRQSSPADPNWPRVGGPFLLWLLTPPPDHSVPNIAQVKHLFSPSGIFAKVDSAFSSFLEKRVDSLVLKRFEPHEVVSKPGSTCRGLNLVVTGRFVVTVEGVETQQFSPPSAFGDLESGPGFYGGRYLYQVQAGDQGGTCIEIPRSIFSELLDGRPHQSVGGSEGQAYRSVGDPLFMSTRDRVNAFAPYYHRSIEIRPTSDPDEYVQKSIYLRKPKSGKGKNRKHFSLRDIEHIVRCLVTCITLQERKFATVPREHTIPNLTLFINPRAMKIWVSGREPAAKELPFGDELKLLHQVCLIDAFAIAKLSDSSLATLYASLIKEAVQLIIGQRGAKVKGKELSDEELEAVVTEEQRKLLMETRVVRTLNAGRIRLVAECEKAMAASQNTLGLILSNAEHARRIAFDYYYNIAFLNWALFSRNERRLLVVNDYPFFRRVTGGGTRWIGELASRMELRVRWNDSAQPEWLVPKRDEDDPSRVHNYLRYVGAYVRAHWRQGWDLDYSPSNDYGRETSWHKLVKEIVGDPSQPV